MRIYAYGAKPPSEGADVVETQLRLAHAFQVALVMIERDRRAAVEALYAEAAPDDRAEYLAAEGAYEVALSTLRLTRATGGDVLPPDEEMLSEQKAETKVARRALDAARERRKAARVSWFEARKRATPGLKGRLREIDEAAYARQKRAYNLAGSVGLYWGTRLKVMQRVEQAAKAAIKEGWGALPRIPRFDGCGGVAVQLQGGLDVADALAGTDTQFRLVKAAASPWEWAGGKSVREDGRVFDLPAPKADGARSRRGVFVAYDRVGSDGRAPVFASWPVSLHRGLPADAKIKWVEMHSRRVGPRVEWQLLVTVDDAAVPLRAEGATLAVNLGWRNLPDTDGEIRVAMAVGSDGRREEIRLPPKLARDLAHVASIQAIRKRNFNEAVKALDDWMEEVEWPADLVLAAKWRDRWLAPRKLARFIGTWRKQRFDGDERFFDVASAWFKQDKHLWFWESDKREKILRARNEFYRTIAARWATEYRRILVCRTDYRDFAAKDDLAADSADKPQRVTQRLASPSIFLGAIKNACSTRGAEVVEVVKKGQDPDSDRPIALTQVCSACGVEARFDARREITHRCIECGAEWDQDVNHCQNLLASDAVMSERRGSLASTESGGAEGMKESKVGRWQQRRSKSAKKKAVIART